MNPKDRIIKGTQDTIEEVADLLDIPVESVEQMLTNGGVHGS